MNVSSDLRMTKSKRQRYEITRNSIESYSDEKKITTSESDAILEFLDAKDPECGIIGNGDTKAAGTLASYSYTLKRTANLADFDLTDCSEYDLNKLMDDIRRGNADGVKDDGLTNGTVRNYQTTLRKFYEYHDFDIDHSEIILFEKDESPVDERDIFEKEEIDELRKAAEHPRDKALIDLLIYTGQRFSAVLNLRLKDVKPSEGVFYLNTDNGDMKGADGKRPLLYAEKSVREWKRRHPCDDPEAYFITHKIDRGDITVGERLHSGAVRKLIKRIASKTDVEKPVNPHNFRHTFVTICKRNYGMDNDTIKRLIGHDASSTVMESTYAHLTDQDVIDAAERATGIKEEEPESPLTPIGKCDNCDEPVPLDNAKACSSCGIAFTPDAKQIEDSLEDKMWDAKGESETDSEDQAVDAIKEIYDENPSAVIQAIMEDSDVDMESLTESS